LIAHRAVNIFLPQATRTILGIDLNIGLVVAKLTRASGASNNSGWLSWFNALDNGNGHFFLLSNETIIFGNQKISILVKLGSNYNPWSIPISALIVGNVLRNGEVELHRPDHVKIHVRTFKRWREPPSFCEGETERLLKPSSMFEVIENDGKHLFHFFFFRLTETTFKVGFNSLIKRVSSA